MTKELRELKKKLGKDITIITPNGDNISLETLCNSTKIDKKIPTKIIRG